MKSPPCPLFLAFRKVVFKMGRTEGHRPSSDLLADRLQEDPSGLKLRRLTHAWIIIVFSCACSPLEVSHAFTYFALLAPSSSPAGLVRQVPPPLPVSLREGRGI